MNLMIIDEALFTFQYLMCEIEASCVSHYVE